MKRFLFTYLIFLFVFFYRVEGQRIINAQYTHNVPKIDGLPIDEAWQNTPFEQDFKQFEPYNNILPSHSTKVKFLYNNTAIYILAECVISSKNEVFDILSNRDNFGQADYFGFYLDPYKTGTTGFGFFVTAAGVQVDLKVDGTSLNYDWDAIWYSAVNITDSAYFVEMKIPYSAFRFPKKNEQSWNINFYRNIQQNREIDTWNYVDNSKTGLLNQMGTIEGINGINPPVRIALMPYVSAYGQKYAGLSPIGKSYSGGMDMKIGLNESFTLDMMLIPDYNQIESDDQVLNLSPYETYYDEKRYFFTEGTEIFNKGHIFYSRRIGKTPTLYNSVPDMLNENEVLLNNPQHTQIYNATKFSGKTNKGFGIGFLNAFTGTTFAQILDTSINRTRTVITEPFSNYNVIALNQPIKNNSYISLTNTNFSSFGRNYYANVVAQEAYLKNKDNSWGVFERLSMSNIFNDTLKAENGFASVISVRKISGKFRIVASQSIYSNTYNPNDLGYLRHNNTVSNSLTVNYNIYEPFWYFLRWRNSLSISQQNLYDSLRYIKTTVTLNSSTKLKNNLTIGARINFSPTEQYDYFEPRVANRFYVREPYRNARFWLSSNYANPFAYDFVFEYRRAILNNEAQQNLSFILSPRILLSNNALFVYSYKVGYLFNDVGYVSTTESQDSIFFGQRNIKNITNTIEFDYIFSKNISLNFKVRHYWSAIDYFGYYTLGDNGKLYPLSYSYHFVSNNDRNYNALNVDLIFKWIFMPGSEFSVVYKKQISASSSTLIDGYYDDFEYMYFNFPRLNSLSFKIIIYLDYYRIFNRQKYSSNRARP